MAEHIWTVVCESSILDARSNNVSLIQVVEQLSVRGATNVVPVKVVVASLWVKTVATGESETIRCRVTWCGPDGGAMGDAQVVSEATIAREQLRLRTFSEFQGIPVRDAGRYRFVVESAEAEDGDWVARASIPVDVVFEDE